MAVGRMLLEWMAVEEETPTKFALLIGNSLLRLGTECLPSWILTEAVLGRVVGADRGLELAPPWVGRGICDTL